MPGQSWGTKALPLHFAEARQKAVNQLIKDTSSRQGHTLSNRKLCLCGMATTTSGEAVALRAELYAARRSAGALQKDLDSVRAAVTF